jgi:natural product biosynthesis luciferase-like monooxygenase protein
MTGPLPRLSLMFFPYAGLGDPGLDLVTGVSRAADDLGMEAVWLPERHFHPFGSLFPNSALMAAVIASQTRTLRLRAGSVVAPLHHPVRIAEDWAVVDQVSGGRVDIAFASGWNADDFVLRPGAYDERKQVTWSTIDTVRRLWRGETVSLPGGEAAPVDVVSYPRPVQAELSVWLTCSGSEERFVEAGTRGVNVLTALLFQDTGALARKVGRYRQAWAEAGHPGSGHVTLMLHAYVHDDAAVAERTASEPMRAYLAGATDLWQGRMAGMKVLEGDRRDRLLDFAVKRQVRTASLIGSPAQAAARLERLGGIGVDEVACQLDFGLAHDAILDALPRLAEVAMERRS